MRKIRYIILHSSATPFNTSIQSIKNYWKNIKKWKSPGYHYIIEQSGNFEMLADVDDVVNGCRGHNYHSINIGTISGENGVDTRTDAQKETLKVLVDQLKKLYPDAQIVGHRDLSPDLNGDGEITEDEWIKQCPCYSVKKQLLKWYASDKGNKIFKK